jgi:hypothetical protein
MNVSILNRLQNKYFNLDLRKITTQEYKKEEGLERIYTPLLSTKPPPIRCPAPL